MVTPFLFNTGNYSTSETQLQASHPHHNLLAQSAPTFFLFIYLWLCCVFVSVRGLSLVVASGGHSSSRCVGLSLSRPLLLRSTGSRRAGSVIVAHGPSCSAACGILPDQGSNPCPLHWQADSQPLRHQGSPHLLLYPLKESSTSNPLSASLFHYHSSFVFPFLST